MMEKFKLPVWLNGPEITKLKTAADNWWLQIEDWLKLPLNQLDAETCHPNILQLLAYQRDVERFPSEPDDLYRKRVKYAIDNAKDAGSRAGFERILQRFDIDVAELVERDPASDWDMIRVKLNSPMLQQNPDLGQYIVRRYGRTCRRYDFSTEDRALPVYFSAQLASVDRQTIYLPVHPLLANL